MNPVARVLWQLITQLLAPQSLSSDKARNKETNLGEWKRLAGRTDALQPGDFILIRTPGKFYKTLRDMSNQSYDHLAVVMEDNQCLHVGPPIIRLLPVQLLISPIRDPLVFRPKLSEQERQDLLASLRGLLGKEYDSVRVFYFIARLWLARILLQKRRFFPLSPDLPIPGLRKAKERWGVPLPGRSRAPSSIQAGGGGGGGGGGGISNSTSSNNNMDSNSNQNPNTTTTSSSLQGDDLSHMICTDAIIDRLLRTSENFRTAARSLRLDYSRLHSWSIRDLLAFYEHDSLLLKPVILPEPPGSPSPPGKKEEERDRSGAAWEVQNMMNEMRGIANTVVTKGREVVKSKNASTSAYAIPLLFSVLPKPLLLLTKVALVFMIINNLAEGRQQQTEAEANGSALQSPQASHFIHSRL